MGGRRRKYRSLDEFFDSGHTMVGLAEECGISTSYLSHICKGRKRPPLDVALLIALKASVPLEAVLCLPHRPSGIMRKMRS